MKTYIKPSFECVELRLEERMAGSCIKTGNCYDPATGKHYEFGPNS